MSSIFALAAVVPKVQAIRSPPVSVKIQLAELRPETLHLRDSITHEHKQPVAIQIWLSTVNESQQENLEGRLAERLASAKDQGQAVSAPEQASITSAQQPGMPDSAAITPRGDEKSQRRTRPASQTKRKLPSRRPVSSVQGSSPRASTVVPDASKRFSHMKYAASARTPLAPGKNRWDEKSIKPGK
jgi:hypothetical protein